MKIKAMEDQIRELIEQYKRRLKSINDMSGSSETMIRLNAKASCYRTMIHELEVILKESKNEEIQ